MSPLRRVGVAVTAGAAVLFTIAFIRIVSGDVPSSCAGSECLRGDHRWLFALPASIFLVVGGVLMIALGGRGSGRSRGPRSFAEVDAGPDAPVYEALAEPTEVHTPKWERSWRNAVLIAGLGEVGLGLLFGVGGLIAGPARAGLMGTGALLCAIGAGCLYLASRAAAKERLRAVGLPGRAFVEAVHRTGTRVNDNPYVKLDLVVRVQGHPAYKLRHGAVVPANLVGRLTDGAALPVRVDPGRPSRMAILWEQMAG